MLSQYRRSIAQPHFGLALSSGDTNFRLATAMRDEMFVYLSSLGFERNDGRGGGFKFSRLGKGGIVICKYYSAPCYTRLTATTPEIPRGFDKEWNFHLIPDSVFPDFERGCGDCEAPWVAWRMIQEELMLGKSPERTKRL